MAREIRIYFEGASDLKEGFVRFFAELRSLARKSRCEFRLISGASGPTADQDYQRALTTHPEAINVLLKDSEGPVKERVADATFLMVETMEAWFHADMKALEKYYGANFQTGALKRNPKVEEIPKQDVVSGLTAVTRNTPKGNYYRNKRTHGADLLGLIDPELVCKAAPNCARLFQAIRALLQPAVS